MECRRCKKRTAVGSPIKAMLSSIGGEGWSFRITDPTFCRMCIDNLYEKAKVCIVTLMEVDNGST